MLPRFVRLRWLTLRARRSQSAYQYHQLGAMYATGDGFAPKDLQKALYWYTNAAKAGHDESQYDLGFMYLVGEGVEANAREGLRWLALAAQQGHQQAIRLLADLYRDGVYGVEQDAERAQYWREERDKEVFAPDD